MNPALHQRQNNTYLSPVLADNCYQQVTIPTEARRLFPNRVAYGPLIPPSGSIARVVMGNTDSRNGENSNNQHSNATPSHQGCSQQRREDQPRTMLSQLIEQHQIESRETISEQESRQTKPVTGKLGEKDHSHPSAVLKTASESARSASVFPSSTVLLHSRTGTPPAAIPAYIKPISFETNVIQSNLKIDRASAGEKVRR